jgi:hypothetical protein
MRHRRLTTPFARSPALRRYDAAQVRNERSPRLVVCRDSATRHGTTSPFAVAAFRRDACDITIGLDHEPDVLQHELEHPSVVEMMEWTGPLTTYAERRAIEHEAARVLGSGAPLEERVAVAEQLLLAFHHRFLRKIAKEGSPRFERCSTEDSIAAANLEGTFAPAVTAALREEYGVVTWPGIAMEKWEYRDQAGPAGKARATPAHARRVSYRIRGTQKQW